MLPLSCNKHFALVHALVFGWQFQSHITCVRPWIYRWVTGHPYAWWQSNNLHPSKLIAEYIYLRGLFPRM
jgi:hypothetical protein